ncbi:MAG TPA: 30S ribosome-binding factor RbfA [Patescibacteria group bacterium]|nr:30S ribosome-binding factor RbfA [Patescibacteria group bacterium]
MKQPKKDTNRIAKVNSLVEHSLGPILHELLQNQAGMVTVSRVETSRDMKWAKVWITIFNGSDEKILNFLAKNIYHIQGELNRSFQTKIVPRISFHLDTAPRYVEHIEEVIRKIHEEK